MNTACEMDVGADASNKQLWLTAEQAQWWVGQGSQLAKKKKSHRC